MFVLLMSSPVHLSCRFQLESALGEAVLDAMAPKAVKIKKEKMDKKSEVCIQGLVGKNLAGKVQRTLAKSPPWLRQYYEGKLKYQKSGSSEAKEEFIRKLLACDDVSESDYFAKIYKSIHKEVEGKRSEWSSWKDMITHDSEEVIILGIKQGKIKQNAHTSNSTTRTRRRKRFHNSCSMSTSV